MYKHYGVTSKCTVRSSRFSIKQHRPSFCPYEPYVLVCLGMEWVSMRSKCLLLKIYSIQNCVSYLFDLEDLVKNHDLVQEACFSV